MAEDVEIVNDYYSELKVYAKYLKGFCASCGQSDLPVCGCCPTGLSAVYDEKGNHLGCLTPRDAYFVNDKIKAKDVICSDNLVKVHSAHGLFLGCVEVGDIGVLLTESLALGDPSFKVHNTTYSRMLNIKESDGNKSCDKCKKDCCDKCSCCPPGTVYVSDGCGTNYGCMTPRDANIIFDRLSASKIQCEEGNIKAYSYDGIFWGCLTPAQHTALKELLDA